jgi:hypothetical protein
MTLNRLYNFVAGQVIQSQQVNAELDQIISSLNTYVVNANFNSNNYIADGDIVSAISALDSQIAGENSGAVAYNYSKGLILQQHSANEYTICIKGSAANLIIFMKDQKAFIEDGTKTLNLSTLGTNQFIDIYIEEDTSDSPAIADTLPIKLTGKGSGSTPYNTSPSSGQYLAGCAYLKNIDGEGNRIIGIQSLEKPDVPTNHWSLWHTSNPFNHQLNSSSFTYSSKCSYIPVFVDSSIIYNVTMEVNSVSGSNGERYNYTVKLKRDSSGTAFFSIREKSIDTYGTVARDVLNISDIDNVSPGIYTYYYGGCINTGEDSNISNMNIHYLAAQFKVQPRYLTFKAMS